MRLVELPPQMHMGETDPKKATYRVKNGYIKPDKGVVWTSSYDPKRGSPWVSYCRREFKGALKPNGYKCTVKKDAKIVEIDSYDDLVKVLRHGKVEEKYLSSASIDFEKLSKDYDGIHLTEEGQWATRLTRPYSLYGWDVESTVFFRDVFEKCKPVNLTRYCKVKEEK